MMTGVGLAAPDEGERGAQKAIDFSDWLRRAPAMLQMADGDGRLIGVSDVWLATLGYHRERVVGRLVSDFFIQGSCADDIEVLDVFRHGRCHNVACKMIAGDGREIDVLLSIAQDQDAGGASTASITDVTALRVAERKLAANERHYRSLVEDQIDLVALSSLDGVLLYVNDAYARHYEKRPQDLIGKRFYDFIPVEAHARVQADLRRACEVDGSVTSDNCLILPDGQVRWMSWTNRALRDEHGRVTGMHAVGRDIEKFVEAERRLKESEARYRLLAEHSTDMVLELDLDLRRLYVSPACREMFGYEPEDLLGEATGATSHPEDSGRVAEALASLLSGRADRATAVARRRHRDGRWIWVETRYRAVKDPQTGATTGIVATVRDISQRKAVEDRLAEAYRRLEAMARQDGLTNLANRRTFDDALAGEYGRARRDNRNLSLIMIDVDGFKLFNDRYGHPAGDECLRRIGVTLAGAVCRPGDLAARYGGEEFAMLLPDTDEVGAAIIAERIRNDVMRMAIQHEGSAFRIITVSAGVAAIGSHALDGGAQALVQFADQALYRAKRAGRNTVTRASAPPPAEAMPPNAA